MLTVANSWLASLAAGLRDDVARRCNVSVRAVVDPHDSLGFCIRPRSMAARRAAAFTLGTRDLPRFNLGRSNSNIYRDALRNCWIERAWLVFDIPNTDNPCCADEKTSRARYILGSDPQRIFYVGPIA